MPPAHSPLDTLMHLLNHDVPHQFVPIILTETVTDTCAALRLPTPTLLGGNLVIGDLTRAAFVLSAHLDEASFNVTDVSDHAIGLFPCHRMPPRPDTLDLTFVGVRDGHPTRLGSATGTIAHPHRVNALPIDDIRLGDRAVYRHTTTLTGTLLTAKALDDRVGAAVALHAASTLHDRGIPVAVVLSDGEQHCPDGYFSRTFPRVLNSLAPTATLIFVDGVFPQAHERDDHSAPRPGAIVVPHSGDGRGHTVPPLLFARLRDDIIPGAQDADIDVHVSQLPHSRGDDWGLVTNPTAAHDHPAFFVSFVGAGTHPAKRVLDTRCLDHCTNALVHCVQNLTRLPYTPPPRTRTTHRTPSTERRSA
ncbi:hypothetical protein [Embleya sp. MST-111070]|uniref:hypothetical protein n=1 Tax=Embleya sp. MST-111070 TaxID=3398231 RepID=UPI003F73CE8E